MFLKLTYFMIFLGITLLSAACQKSDRGVPQGTIPATLAEVPAARLNFRYEADVPGPDIKTTKTEERNPLVQADFDQSRPQEILDKSFLSPDKKHFLVVYHRPSDIASEFRLDMYSGEGKLLRKITPDAMAAHFPDTIVWSPDSSSVAFVGLVRAGQGESDTAPANPAISNPVAAADANTEPANTADNANYTGAPANSATSAPTPAAPTGILTLRTEQLYICNAEGSATKALTQNEGLIYFYYVWSPDSSMLASLASTSREWDVLQKTADAKGEVYVPAGRPRVVEKNGRERRLDDAATTIRPVWSPDSTKVSVSYGTQVRIYDADGNNPTQAAIPLRNQLLISSQAFDLDQQRKLQAANGGGDANGLPSTASTPEQSTTTPPDEKNLVSFNPIVELEWTGDDILYFRTAYVKRMKNDADSVTSFARWHRLIFSFQP